MKFLGKLILWLLVALLLVIVGAWFLLQTHWGARQASAWLSNGTGWQVSFDAMEHDFSSPLHVQLQNVTFGREGKPATLVAKTVDIGFSTRQFSDPLHADEIVLNDGTLNLSPHSADLPFAADRLMLRNMAFNSPETGWALSAQRVTGGVSPWTPEAGNVLGKTAQIQMSAGSMTLNGVEASNVLIQGRIDQGEVTLSTLGADVARGTLTGNAKRSADGSWLVDNLQLNEIRLQSPASLAEFFRAVNHGPLSADWPPGYHRRPPAGAGLGGNRPRPEPAQPDAQPRRLAEPGRHAVDERQRIYLRLAALLRPDSEC